jgi:hypothetical protein
MNHRLFQKSSETGREGDILYSLLCLLADVKLLRLGCRISACGLRLASVSLVFYSSFGSQNTLQCAIQRMKMPPTVWN